MTKAEAWKIVGKRSKSHQRHSNQRVLSKDYERIGFEGEWAFALALQIPINLEKIAYGNGGTDFVVNGKKIDIKTCSESSANGITEEMWIEVKKCRDNVLYVMSLFLSRREKAIILGWEYGHIVRQWPKIMSPWEINNYVCGWYALKHPWYLFKELGRE